MHLFSLYNIERISVPLIYVRPEYLDSYFITFMKLLVWFLSSQLMTCPLRLYSLPSNLELSTLFVVFLSNSPLDDSSPTLASY